MKLRDLVPEFEKFHIRHKKASYQQSLNQRMKQTVLPFFGDMEIDKIGRRDIGDFKQFLVDLELSPKTINEHLSVLSLMFKCAIEREHVDTMPQIKRVPSDKKFEFKFLEADEVKRLMAAVDDTLIYAMVKFAVHTGLRIGEIRALEWKHIDFVHNTVRVCQTTAGDKQVIGSVKGSENRTIPLTADAREAVQGLCRQTNLVFIPRIIRDGIEVPLGYETCHRGGIVKAAKLANLHQRGFGFHTLRHTYASHLARKGVSLFLIQKWLGHVDIRITQRYAHLAPDTGHVEAQVLSGLFS